MAFSDDFEQYLDSNAIKTAWAAISGGVVSLATGDEDFGQAMSVKDNNGREAVLSYPLGVTPTNDGTVRVRGKPIKTGDYVFSPDIWAFGVFARQGEAGFIAAYGSRSSGVSKFVLILDGDTTLEADPAPDVVVGSVYEVEMSVSGADVVATLKDASGNLLATLSGTTTITDEGKWGTRTVVDNHSTKRVLVDDFFLDTATVTPISAPRPRVRSSMSLNAGSLLESTDAPALEGGYSEAFLPGDAPEVGALYDFREFMTPEETSLVYYPQPTNNHEFLDTQTGESMFGRMARTYPSPIMAWGLDEAADGLAFTGQEAVQLVLDAFAREFSWFDPEDAPDLRFRAFDPNGGVLTTAAISIPQTPEGKKTMREILDELLEIFSPTLQTITPEGRYKIICLNGPDAPEDTKAIGWVDILEGGMSISKPDVRTVINAAEVTSQGYVKLDEQEPLEPAWFAWRHENYYAAEASFFDPPDDRVAISSSPHRTSAPLFWPLGDGVLPYGNINFDNLDLGELLSANYRHTKVDGSGNYEEGPMEMTYHSGIFLDGNTYKVATFETSGGTLSFSLYMRYSASLRGVVLAIADIDAVTATADIYRQDQFAMFEVYLNSVATIWGRNPSRITARFDATYAAANGITLPVQGDPGADLMALSMAQHDLREASLRSNFFQLTPEQAQEIVQGYVLANIEAKVIKEIRQSTHNAFPVKFGDIGAQVNLPTGEKLLVEARDYSDSFTFAGGSLASTFRGTVTQPPILEQVCLLTDHYGRPVLDDEGRFFEGDCGASPSYPEGSGSENGGTVQPPGPVVTGGTSLLGDESFSDTLKGGAAMSAAQLEPYNSLLAFFDNNQEYGGNSVIPLYGGSTSYFGGRTTEGVKQADAYLICRFGQKYLTALFSAFRITGDLRLLDHAVRLMDAFYPSWIVGWVGQQNPPSSGPSPYKCVRSYGGGQPADLYGTDRNLLTENRLWGMLTEAAYAFEVNRGLTSPGGLDYGAASDKWQTIIFAHFIPKWRGGGESGWRSSYEGFQVSGGSFTRAGDGAIPFLQRWEGHTFVCKLKGDYYAYLLTGDEAYRTSMHSDAAALIADEWKEVATSYGNGRISRQGIPSRQPGSPLVYAQHYYYFDMTYSDLLDLALEGAYSGIDWALVGQFARSMAAFWLPSANDPKKDIVGGVTRTATDSTSVPPSAFSAQPSIFHTVYYAQGALIAFDTPDDHLETELSINFNSAGGGFAAPKAPFIPLGLFLKRVL